MYYTREPLCASDRSRSASTRRSPSGFTATGRILESSQLGSESSHPEQQKKKTVIKFCAYKINIQMYVNIYSIYIYIYTHSMLPTVTGMQNVTGAV